MDIQTKQTQRFPRVSFTETFQSSEAEKQPKFSLDRSLARGITQNNSSLIVDAQPLTTVGQQQTFDIVSEAEKELFNLRSNYDKAKTAVKTLQTKINLMNQQKKKLTEQKYSLTQLNNDIESNYHKTKNNLDSISQTVEQMVLRFDSYKNIEQRLKTDNLYYKKHIFDCNMQIKKLNNDLRRFTLNSQRQQKISLRCRNLLQSVQKTVQQNNHERKRGIENLGDAVYKRRQYAERQKQRRKSFQLAMQEAQNSKLPYEKQLINVLRTHQFVKKLLQSKMQTLMSRYEEVNMAFTKIRQNTGIKTTSQMINNYLKKDQIYGSLLESISTLEPKIQTLKNQEKIIKDEYRILVNKKEELDQAIKHIEHKDLQSVMSENTEFNQKLQKIDQFRNLLTNWGATTISMFKGVKKTEVRNKYQYLKDMVEDCLKILIKYFQQSNEAQKSISERMLDKQAPKKQQREQLLGRNIRIKTLGAQKTNQQDDVQYDLRTQKQYIHVTRKAIKKRYIHLHKHQIKV